MALPLSLTQTDARSSERERHEGRLLGRLGPRGYVVLPDGVIVGPNGVAVVTTITSDVQMRVHHGELWLGRFPRRNDLAQATRRVAEVERAVGASDAGIPVRSLVCVLGAPPPEDPYCTLPVVVCGPDELPSLVEAGPVVLTFEEVLQLAKDLDPARRRWSSLRSARWRSR